VAHVRVVFVAEEGREDDVWQSNAACGMPREVRKPFCGLSERRPAARTRFERSQGLLRDLLDLHDGQMLLPVVPGDFKGEFRSWIASDFGWRRGTW
jgi:hypothetical protein